MSAIADTRLYGAVISLVSGTYSIASALVGEMAPMRMSDSIMLLVGVVVILHGVSLMTPLADRFGSASGALMLLWATIMLGNQAIAATSAGAMMSGSESWDGGMVALAVLMLASGGIMIRAQNRR